MLIGAAPRAPRRHLPHVCCHALLLHAETKSCLLTPNSTPPHCDAYRAATQRNAEATAAAAALPRVTGVTTLIRTKVAIERRSP
jgi:hypothetical protein